MKQPNGLCIGNIVFFFVFSPVLARRRHLPKHKLCDLLSAYSAPDFNDGNMYLLGLLPHMQKFLSTLWILYFRIPDNTPCLLNPGGQILPTTPHPPPPLVPDPIGWGIWASPPGEQPRLQSRMTTPGTTSAGLSRKAHFLVPLPLDQSAPCHQNFALTSCLV